MNFRDIPLNISYTTSSDDSFSQILNPLLSCAKTYKRSVGFFSSSALSFIGDGLFEMARNGGRVFLATSPNLSAEDVLAIQSGYEERNILENRFLEEVKQAFNEISDKNAQILYFLVKEGIVDVKIVVKNDGIYHVKIYNRFVKN